MIAKGKVLARGQVTLPREIREAAGFEPGDLVTFRTTGPRTVEINTRPRLTLNDLIERYPITEPVDETADAESWLEKAMNDSLCSMRGL